MKKSIFILAAGLILLGAGCAKQNAVTNQAPDEKTSPAAASAIKCASIKTASSQPIFNGQDAANLLGGSFNEPEFSTYSDDCLYRIDSKATKSNGYFEVPINTIIVQGVGVTSYDSMLAIKNGDNTTGFKFKDAPELGADAFFATTYKTDGTPDLHMLYFKKPGNNTSGLTVSVSGASDQKVVEAARVIMSRW